MTATTVGALLVGRRIDLRNVFIVREELQIPGSPRSVFRLVGQIALIMVALELVGVIFLTIDFSAGVRSRERRELRYLPCG